MYQLYRDFNLVKKGQKIRAWVNPRPPFWAMPERKRAFTYEVFPYTYTYTVQCRIAWHRVRFGAPVSICSTLVEYGMVWRSKVGARRNVSSSMGQSARRSSRRLLDQPTNQPANWTPVCSKTSTRDHLLSISIQFSLHYSRMRVVQLNYIRCWSI